MSEEKLSFEKKISELEKISKKLQSPETELEKAVELYESGIKLARELDNELSKMERKVEIITSSSDEEMVVTQDYN